MSSSQSEPSSRSPAQPPQQPPPTSLQPQQSAQQPPLTSLPPQQPVQPPPSTSLPPQQAVQQPPPPSLPSQQPSISNPPPPPPSSSSSPSITTLPSPTPSTITSSTNPIPTPSTSSHANLSSKVSTPILQQQQPQGTQLGPQQSQQRKPQQQQQSQHLQQTQQSQQTQQLQHLQQPQHAQQPQHLQQPQSSFHTSQTRTPPWSQSPHYSQFPNASASSPVPASAVPSSVSAASPRGSIAIGVPAHRPAVTPAQPTSLATSFTPSTFAAQYAVGRAPVHVSESMARSTIHGMQNIGMMAHQIRPGTVAVHHQPRPGHSSVRPQASSNIQPVRPQTSSNSQPAAPQNFQGHGLVRTSSAGSPSLSFGTSQAMPSQHQPWLTPGPHGRPPMPSGSFRPQTSSQSLQQRSHIVQQSHQAMPPTAQQQHPASSQHQHIVSSQQHHPVSSQHHPPSSNQPQFSSSEQQQAVSSHQQHPSSSQQQQPSPSSNQPPEHHSQQLPSPMISQSVPNQQVTRVQVPGNPKSSSPASAHANVTQANANDRMAVVEADESGDRILSKRSIQELVNQVDPYEKLDVEVEEILVDIGEEFIDSIITFGCSLAKHRKSNTLEAKDILLHLERNWNMTLPGFSGDEIKTFKKPVTNDVHKERLAVIRKSMASNDGLGSKSSAGQAAGNIKGHLPKTAPDFAGS